MVIFIIPVYNEAENIVNLFNRLNEAMLRKNLPYKVIMVNDGSTDDTARMLESLKGRFPVDVYSHYPQQGVGVAFRVGFRQALEIAADDDLVITKEADNTSDIRILDELIAGISQGSDVVLASCYARAGAVVGTTVFRLVLSKGVNLLFKLLLRQKDINTYTSFYRAYSARALKQMQGVYGDQLIVERGFECMAGLLIRFIRLGKFKITEVPMVLDGAKRAGRSKMRILKTTKGFIKLLFKESIIYAIGKHIPPCFLRKQSRGNC